MPECLFCAIAAETVSATRVLATDRVLAFRDIDPQAPTHVLVIPRPAGMSRTRAGRVALPDNMECTTLGGRSSGPWRASN